MTTPNLPAAGIPGDSPTASGFADFAAKSAEDWQEEQKPPVHGSFSLIGGFRGLLINALMGLVAGPLQFLSDLFSLRWAQVDDHDSQISGLQSLVQDVPLIGDFFELVTGQEDSNPSDAASFIRNTIRMLLGGYRNVDPATIPEEDITPLELTVISSEIQNRITALEGGVTEHLLPESTTIDLSMYEEIEVILFGSSAPGGNGGTIPGFPLRGGNGSSGGGYIFQAYSKADLISLLGSLTAVKCVIGANGGKTYFGADSLTTPTVNGSVLSTLASSNIVGTPEGFEVTESGPVGGGVGGTGATASTFATAGSSGAASAIGAGGAGGAAGAHNTTTSAAGNAQPGAAGAPGQVVGRTKCGGSGAGAGGGGGIYFEDGTFVDRYYGRNGGNGATGGFPGGGSSGGGGAGQGADGNGSHGVGGAGVNGLMFIRGK